MMPWIQNATRMVFFTGKGGVGKTSLACAVAVALADRARKTLLVSTDPASNLGQVFGIDVDAHTPAAVAEVPNLFVLNIDPAAAARAYRNRIIDPMRGALPPDAIKGIEEQLSGACTTEIAAFDEFTELLTDNAALTSYAHVIFDTAPTGHTLRLLQLPSAWSNFLASNQSGASCLGPLSGLEKQRQRYAQAVAALADAKHTTFVLVSRPQSGPLAEAERTRHELQALGIVNQQLVINGVMPETSSDDPVARAWISRQRQALASTPAGLAHLPTTQIALQSRNLVGVVALRALFDPASPGESLPVGISPSTIALAPLSRLIDEIEADKHGLVMVLGKGGVGKTTIAAAVAVELAKRGHAVHLTTTDPAAHLSMTIQSDLPGLEVSRIDPHVESERYRHHVLDAQGKHLDAAGRALLAEDLRSPCTEEIAVFQAFSRVMRESKAKFVIVDTAPTGHTLLLLDATGAYHRDVVRHMAPGVEVHTPLMQLQDPQQTKMLIVTTAETTPVLEAEALQADLERAGIQAWAWVVNASLSATRTVDPLLAARAQTELPQLEHVRHAAARFAVVPWLASEPVGSQHLLELAEGTHTASLG